MSKSPLILAASFKVLTTGVAFSGGHGGNSAVKARQSHMSLYAHNLGILGGMAKGEVAYDADTATSAANNLVSMSTMSHVGYWTPGTSNAELGEETRALPALWEAGSKAGEYGGDLAKAAAALAAVAGDGQEALGPALGGVGKACGACHKAYQQPK